MTLAIVCGECGEVLEVLEDAHADEQIEDICRPCAEGEAEEDSRAA